MIVCGDHGMRDGGGHGGSTFSEVMVPLVSFGIDCVVEEWVAHIVPGFYVLAL